MTCHCDQPYCSDPRHFIVETTTTPTPGSLKRPREEDDDDEDEEEGDDDDDDDDDVNAKHIKAEPEDETFEPVEAATTPSTSRSRTISREPEVDYDNASRTTLPSILENIYYVVAMAMSNSGAEGVDFSHVQLPPIRNFIYSDGVVPDYLRGEIDEGDVTELPNGLHFLVGAFPETEDGLLMEIEQHGDPESSAFEALVDGDAIVWL